MNASAEMKYPRTLEEILRRLLEVTGVEAVTIAREDGLVVAHRLPTGADAKKMAAMAAALFGSGTKVAEELDRGDLHNCWLQCEQGKAVVFRTPGSTILIALLSEGANMGLAMLALERAAEEIGQALTTLLEAQVP
jgi:predicted regulator of Ras-like GTPase activity (Roadblock/LC7/MglB family)